MKIITNEKLISRNKKLSQYALYGALAVLLLGFILTFNNPDTSEIGWAYLILIPGYILVQVSIHLGNKWGRSPRPDEIVSQSFKGLDDRYSLYHYTTGVPHLLIGPAGIWIIKPYHQSGQISYDSQKKKYQQKGGANIFTKLFSQEGIGDIEHDSRLLRKKLQKYFSKLSIQNYAEPKTVNVFYSEKVDVKANNAPELTLNANKLKNYIRKYSKSNPAEQEMIDLIKKMLPD
ncbi:MAG TPA: hypothetical protein G4N92_09745 [Anaerolineae bacterium]|nr:hypothetical protein [Anaerolineae bacterium]